jgi:hypothetical protein
MLIASNDGVRRTLQGAFNNAIIGWVGLYRVYARCRLNCPRRSLDDLLEAGYF